MPSSVHITVYEKNSISRLVNRQHPYIMVIVCASLIRQLLRIAIEAEQSGQLVIRYIIAVKLIRHGKGKRIAACALLQRHAVPCNAQNNLVIHISRRFLVKHLFHSSLKIQQIHPIRRIADSVVFLYAIIIRLFSIFNAYQIHYIKRACLLRKLPDNNACIRTPSNRQIPPSHLIEAGMYRHPVKSGIVTLRIGFQIFRQLRRRFSVKSPFMEIRYIVQFLLNMKGIA